MTAILLTVWRRIYHGYRIPHQLTRQAHQAYLIGDLEGVHTASIARMALTLPRP